jgi:hypothetical protein
MKKSSKNEKDETKKIEKFPLPIYNEEEDIYAKEKKLLFEEEGLTDAKKLKTQDENPGIDLDVPGSELDDADEKIGEEDEENNYYSLGGESHEDLEDDKE